MNCYYCGVDIGDEQQCPYCGADQRIYWRILHASAQAYNEGLQRAQVRDLSGAAVSLHRSLRMNKYNTQARNLLGLVYFEMGQTTLALREWVVSKNFQPDDNPDDRYLTSVQKPGILNRLDSIAQKYNQALAYCRQDSRDLARIQLKRIIGSHPKLVEAYQLLALLLIQDGKYEEARRALVSAAKIDSKNPITMAYMEEVRASYTAKKKSRRRRRARKDEPEMAVGAEAVVAPQPGILEVLDGSGSGIVNILLGAGLGILVAMFLIVPTMRQNENNDAQNALVSANKEAATSANNIASLEKQVEALNKELDKYTGQGDLKTSYEKLLEAQEAMDEGDSEKAVAAIGTVNETLLSANGKAVYESINGTIQEEAAKDTYAEGSSAFRSRKYEEAIPLLLQVVEFDPEYSDGYALYYLAQSYENTEDTKSAAKYYAQFAELFPNTSRGRVAKSKAESMGASDPGDEETVEAVENEQMAD